MGELAFRDDLKISFSLDSKAVYDEKMVNIHYKAPVLNEKKKYIPEENLRSRQEEQMRQFYENLEEKKAKQLQQDIANRKHHDTIL